jgi:hypothetical protein
MKLLHLGNALNHATLNNENDDFRIQYASPALSCRVMREQQLREMLGRQPSRPVRPIPPCPGPSERVRPVFVTTHVLSGVLIGAASRGRPTAAFVAGIGSHLALDSIPHWGCDQSIEGGYEKFLRVAKRDGLTGLAMTAAAVAAVGKRDRNATIAAIAGAVLLDLDKPFLFFFGVNPFPRLVVRLHSRVQNESPNGMGNEIAYGATFAAVDALTIAARRRSSPFPKLRGATRPS